MKANENVDQTAGDFNFFIDEPIFYFREAEDDDCESIATNSDSIEVVEGG